MTYVGKHDAHQYTWSEYRGKHRNCTCTDISEAEVRILIDVLGCPAHGDGSDEATQ